MTRSVVLRPGTPADLPFLEEMIYEAAFHPQRPRPPFAEALRQPHVARWTQNWGRSGDTAMLAIAEEGYPVGAAWYRLFSQEEEGNAGFVAADTPILALAVGREYRGRGIGGSLLESLKQQARMQGFSSLSLSVGSSNPARHLYERLGFLRVDACHSSPWTMHVTLVS